MTKLNLYDTLDAKDIFAFNQLYLNAKPYPHIILDDFFPKEIADQLETACRNQRPNNDVSNLVHQNKKFELRDHNLMNIELLELLSFFHSSRFLKFLEQISNINGLIPDPHLEGGGLHSTKNGGFLHMHTDFNFNESLSLFRRINILYYMNTGWKKDWKGDLFMSTNPGKEKLKDMKFISPIQNRLLIFETSDISFHGHPEPNQFPEDFPRTSIALYYYTVSSPKLSVRRRFRSKYARFIPSKDMNLSLEKLSFKGRIGNILRRWTPFNF